METQSITWRQRVTRWVIAAIAVGWMTAIACGVWYEVARRRQANFAEQLAARIVAAEARPSRAVVAELTLLDDAGVEPLVRLASLQRRDVAIAARGAVNQLLQTWELEATESGDVRQFAERTTALSAALERHAAEFGPETQRWANGLAERLVTHSDQFAPADSWEILANCDLVLSRPLQPREARPVPIVAVAEPLAPSTPPAKPLAAAVRPQASAPAKSNGDQQAPANDGPKGDLSVLGPVTSSGSSFNFKEQLGNTLRSALRFADEHAGASRGSDQPVRVTPMGPVIDVPSPQETRLQSRRLRTQPPAAPAADAHVVKLDSQSGASDQGLSALGPRGRDAVAELTKQINTLPPDERLASLERAAQLPPVEARRLLRNFVNDAEPKIRIQALTMLATAGDPQLMELARERAVEDADPRVSAFASELLRKR
ncbi:hypothetical protein [Lacipirellula sp.]|uniref:hypothetical protein n=1 Tax=Lacipirellula sp. TaxID=2691419 RepID=UPI003D09B436